MVGKGERQRGLAPPLESWVGNVKRLLVLLDQCGVADAIQHKFCLDALREAFPDAQVVLLASEDAANVVEPDRAGYRVVISHLYKRREKSSLARLRVRQGIEFLKLMRQVGTGYDLVVTLAWGSTLLNILGALAGKRQVGFANRFPFLLSGDLGTYNGAHSAGAEGQRLLNAMGIRAQPPTPQITKRNWTAGTRRRIVLHVGSDWPCQRWLPRRWAELGDWLVSEFSADVVFTGLRHEAELIRRIQGQMKQQATSLAGRTSLADVQDLLATADLCISVDSGIQMLARRTGTPTIVIGGASLVAPALVSEEKVIVLDRTAPQEKSIIFQNKQLRDTYGWCLNEKCPHAGLGNITVEDVKGTVIALLEEASMTGSSHVTV